MKTARKLIILLSCLLLAFFLIALVCYEYYRSTIILYNIVVVQLIVFAIAAFSVIVYSVVPLFRRKRALSPDISKIVLLSETNALMDEFSLANRKSALIVKGDFIDICLQNDLAADEYAVINCVANYWYIERVSDTLSVGLKRGGEQYVYKLKPALCYRLYSSDIIYIENERLLVI
jgi:hypothetical protein